MMRLREKQSINLGLWKSIINIERIDLYDCHKIKAFINNIMICFKVMVYLWLKGLKQIW